MMSGGVDDSPVPSQSMTRRATISSPSSMRDSISQSSASVPDSSGETATRNNRVSRVCVYSADFASDPSKQGSVRQHSSGRVSSRGGPSPRSPERASERAMAGEGCARETDTGE